MKKFDMTKKVVLIIGFISLFVGLYSAVTGGEINEYLFLLFIGLGKEGHLQH